MAGRHEPRVRCVLPVKVAGTDSDGNRFERLTCTLDISDRGARITGIPDKLRPGMEVEITSKTRRAMFRIAWIGQTGTRTENQIGLLSSSKEPEFWPELRKHQMSAEDYAERERQAQQHAREAVAPHIVAAVKPKAAENFSPTQRLRAATEEMFELARLIEHGAVEPAALQEFRQAVGYVRNTSWMLQQWYELQHNQGERLPLMTMLNTERIRLATSLCADLSEFLGTTNVELDLGLIDRFVNVVKPLFAILSATVERRS
jgi:hypothetical protein